MTFDEYKKKAMTTALQTDKDLMTLYYRTLGLTNEAGEVAGKVKKIIRDRNGEVDSEYADMIAGELGDVLWYLQAVADYFDIPFEKVAKKNIEKLASRKQRGQIKGDGDNR